MKFYIILRCIIAYSKAIKVAKKVSTQELHDYLIKHSLEAGVCAYVHYELWFNVYKKKWIKRNLSEGRVYWCSTAPTVENLQFRLNILKKELWKL